MTQPEVAAAVRRAVGPKKKLPPDVDRLALKVEEAAAALGVSRAHLYNMMRRGEIRAVKLGDSTRIPVAELNALLAGDAA